MSRHLAIVPALNEAGSIAQTVAEIHQHAADFDVLVVDDGSTDDTAAIATAAGARVRNRGRERPVRRARIC